MSEIIKRINDKVGQAFEDLCSSIDTNTPLEPKVKELIRLACVVTDRSNFGIRLHTMQALGLGATRDEIIGTILSCLPVTGIESVAVGVSSALTVIETMEDVSHGK